MDIQRIKDMEKELEECISATEDLNSQLDRMEAIRDGMTALFEYYGSDRWFEDREGELPAEVKAGVLSEDAVYDQISEVRDTAFRMIEIATDILKNRI
ncbi:MAG: DUF4298 domain-containing protein [Clostridia bacterium]|nr:DUF4298 domain-containing protein [Clostridia bacterium]